MSHSSGNSRLPKPIAFLFENSLFLIFGAVGAMVWANVDFESYDNFVHFPITGEHHEADVTGELADDGHQEEANTADEHGSHGHGVTIHFLINDILMAMFFAIAASEVWEALLPGGALSNPMKGATPLLATLGGFVGPAGLYLLGAVMIGKMAILGSGWAIPCATDIAFSYLVARMIFGNGHPAIAFLLLLAIADDAAGLAILAVAYPQGDGGIQLQWLLLVLGGMAACGMFRKFRIQNFWIYLLTAGTLSWVGFLKAGIHPALGLVPIIPCLPHAHTDLGIFARAELHRSDTLNALTHWWKNPVEIVLGLFGLVNAGVPLESENFGAATWLVLLGLIIGKPVGIMLFTFISEKCFKLQIPSGMTYRHIFVIGLIASIGFTVSLFVTTAAFPTSGADVTDEQVAVSNAAKLGALLSFAGAAVAFAGAKALGIRPSGDSGGQTEETTE